ncbi:MAG: hypothetical protein MUP90_02470, partial [Gammaproteobacteria bacterium]|nr:hypothetical protein [Gammaproteobacteria bacterium]
VERKDPANLRNFRPHFLLIRAQIFTHEYFIVISAENLRYFFGMIPMHMNHFLFTGRFFFTSGPVVRPQKKG